MSSKTTCYECGNEYKQIGIHWTTGLCEHPSFSERQREILTGLVMGDGHINRSSKNPHIVCEMIMKEYLEYISGIFGVLGGDVSLLMTAEENAKRSRDYGFSPDADPSNYSDVYRWSSMCHPELQEFADWYATGEKVWPADIELTPTVLKHWYCGDGHWHDSGSHNCIRISMSNEVDHTDKIDTLFETVGLPAPSNYNICERIDGSRRCSAEWTVAQSKELWEYMGDPLPGFEYKWPEEYC